MGKAAVVGSTVAGGFAPTASEGIYVKPGSKAMDTGTSLLKESFPTILFLKIIFTPSKAGETDEELRQWHMDMSETKGKEGNDSSKRAGNAGEVELPREGSYEKARNKAQDILGDLGADSKPAKGRLKTGKENGKIIGRQSADGKIKMTIPDKLKSKFQKHYS